MLEFGVVRTIVQGNESPEYIDVDGPSYSGRPLGILAGDSPGSVLTKADIDSIRTLYGTPDSVVLRAPKEHERADWDIPSWTCFYEYNFRQVFKFPIPSLARHLLVYYDIAPGQLMPNSWRNLISLFVLREKYNLPFGIDLTTNDRMWKDMFFFAKGLLIDGPFGNEMYAYRRVWNRYELINAESKPKCDDAVSRTQRVLVIPAEKRSWKVLMAEAKSLSSMKFTMPNPEEALKKQKEAMAKRRATALAKKKSVEAAFKDKSIVHVIEQPLKSSLETDPLRPPKRRKTAEDKGKGKSIDFRLEDASTEVVRKRAELTSVTFPKEVSVFNEHNNFLKKSNDLLFSVDGELLKGKKTEEMIDASLISTFQAFQMQLALKDRYFTSRKKCSDLQKENDSLKRDLESTHTKLDPHAEIADWEEAERLEADKSSGDGYDGESDTGSKDATNVDSLPLLDAVDPDHPIQDSNQDQRNP
ncbi:hypothetical protein Dsin_002306 [Dipteronia sinensis]|uniref:Uncharacterized protein n=1 Tax=Dipteronia sinensis TaxID=43782 RepID=A0AAE0EL42_9ROSI|nr:hypothetical protein Dsin_002306 [Dipteronia sinensis]